MRLRFLAFFLTVSAILSCKKEPDILKQLDAALEMSATYDGYFLQRVDVLRGLLKENPSPEHEYDIRTHLAQEFSAYSMDSTLSQLRRCLRISEALKDPLRKCQAELRMVNEYAAAGYLPDARDLFLSFDADNLPQGLEPQYYETAIFLYGELAAYSSNNSQYWKQRDAFRQLLLPYLKEGSYEWFDQQRVQAEAEHNNEAASAYAIKALEATTPNSRQYARAAFFVSTYYKDEPEIQAQWLARSAIADVMCATKDYASLNDLAQLLYEKGDIDRAFKYVADHCMKDALFFNGKLRPWQIAQFFPALEEAYDARKNRSSRIMLGLIIIAFLLVLALVYLFIDLSRRQTALQKTRQALEDEKNRVERRNNSLSLANEQLTQLNDALQEANKVRQEYIGLFLQNLSENISTSRQYKNHVLKYIRRGNDKYLIEEIEALPPIEEDISEFNRMFDKTFVNLYPDFVEKFNALLQDGEAITPKGEDILTPELRVFALIKLGIGESSKIASLLHYSANTVYNYRAKIKNKARGDRELFEQSVQAIE